MQLGKLDVSQPSQTVDCKTERKRTKTDQGVTPAKQSAEFEPLEHSAYLAKSSKACTPITLVSASARRRDRQNKWRPCSSRSTEIPLFYGIS
jgi:hypothetical protein